MGKAHSRNIGIFAIADVAMAVVIAARDILIVLFGGVQSLAARIGLPATSAKLTKTHGAALLTRQSRN